MQRRIFLKTLISVLPALPILVRPTVSNAWSKPAPKEVLLQTSPVAGFQFYDDEELWSRLKLGATLLLVAEPNNPHDPQAVKVMHGTNQLGYIPRRNNTAVSQMLIRNQPLIARITSLKRSRDPWERIAVDILLVAG